VPTKQCVRADEERLLARSPQKSTGRSEEDTIGVLQTRAGDLSAKNRKLMSEHDDLELLEITRTQTQRRHREDAPKQQIRQRHEQGQDSLLQDAEVRLYGREVTSDASSSDQTIYAPHRRPRGVLVDETGVDSPYASLMDKIRKWLGMGKKT
jgi:hypothetical protein